MIFIYRDGTGYQKQIEQNPALRPGKEIDCFELTGENESRIRAGETWRLNATADGIEFLTLAEIEAEDLKAIQAEAEPSIDSKATETRRAYVSPNKDATYQEKAAELQRWIDAGRPSQPGGFAYMEAEAAARGVTLGTVGAEIETARNLWQQIDPQIEAISRAGKVAAQAAATAEAAQTAVDDAIAALEALKP